MNSTENVPERAPATLSITDLQAMLEVIGICSRRGAFEPQELSSVGQLFDRISAFLAVNTPTEPAADTQIQEQPND